MTEVYVATVDIFQNDFYLLIKDLSKGCTKSIDRRGNPSWILVEQKAFHLFHKIYLIKCIPLNSEYQSGKELLIAINDVDFSDVKIDLRSENVEKTIDWRLVVHFKDE
jgi:hypothetical protein